MVPPAMGWVFHINEQSRQSSDMPTSQPDLANSSTVILFLRLLCANMTVKTSHHGGLLGSRGIACIGTPGVQDLVAS